MNIWSHSPMTVHLAIDKGSFCHRLLPAVGFRQTWQDLLTEEWISMLNTYDPVLSSLTALNPCPMIECPGTEGMYLHCLGVPRMQRGRTPSRCHRTTAKIHTCLVTMVMKRILTTGKSTMYIFTIIATLAAKEALEAKEVLLSDGRVS